MRKIAILLTVGFFTLVTFTADSHAGPWTLNKGRFWMETFTRYMYSCKYFDSKNNEGRWPNGGWSGIYDVEEKLEYGVTDNFNLLLGVPYTWGWWKDGNGTSKNEGFKEINLGAKYKFLQKPVTAAVQIKAFFQPRGIDRNKQPELNEYGDALEIRGLIGKSWSIFDGKQFYVSGEAGYKWSSKWISTNKYANMIPLFAEAGFAPFSWLMLKGEVDCMISHPGTGEIKDTYTWRAGPILNLVGEGFTAVERGEDYPDVPFSLNVELQYGRTFAGRGDPDNRWNGKDRVSMQDEYILKVQLLF